MGRTHPSARAVRALAAAVGAVCAAGCSQGSGIVEGPRLAVGSCEAVEEPAVFEPFVMRLTFLGVVREGDRAILRASPVSSLPVDTDQLVLAVPHVSEIGEGLRAAGEATLAIGPDDVQLGLALRGRCPAIVDALVGVDGAVTFTAFGTKPGDRVRATLAFDLLEQRSGEVVATGFTGTLDFEVAVGTPYQLFNDPAAQVGE